MGQGSGFQEGCIAMLPRAVPYGTAPHGQLVHEYLYYPLLRLLLLSKPKFAARIM